MISQTLHTHTTFCDGKNSVEEMILGALKLGLDSIGLSAHSELPFYSRWSMQPGVSPHYHAEVLRQRERYGDRIPIFLGLEQDYFSNPPEQEYEYIIGSVHYVKKGDAIYPMDKSAEAIQQAADEGYGGDVMGLAEDYYALVADVARKTRCQIVGHFDLLCKYNEGDCCFDTHNARYMAAATDALDVLAKQDLVFEINTGAMARGKRVTPYPARELLLAMRERNLPICICSDSHSAETLLYGYREASELARSCGYRECMYWDGRQFHAGPLPG